MTRGAKGCLLATGVMLIVLVVVAAAVMWAGGIRAGTVVKFTIAGDIADDTEDSLRARLLFGEATRLRDIVNAIERARTDDNVAGIMAVIKPYSMGLGKVQELRDAIKGFRASGKWARVYMDSAGEFSSGNSVYYLATAFDEIWLSPAGDVNLYGLLSVTPFLRGTLDKLGVYPDFDSIGKYKNAKDIYTEKTMTEAHREATMSYMQDWHGQIVAGIAEQRGMDRARVEAVINEGPFTGDEALDKGLIDKLGYYDEFEKDLEDRADGEMPVMKYTEYMDKQKAPSARSRIAVITGVGLIINGRSSLDPAVGYLMGSETITEAFRRARTDRGIKAIIFRVDSPGGSAVGSDLIRREVELAMKEKPVIISMSDLAASGGYWVSAGATRIVSQPATLTGSIGVVAGKMVTKGFYDWIGLNRETVGIGDHADYYYDGTRFTEEEKALYWKFMNKIYDKFTTLVADGRGMDKDAVDRIGQGHVWTGERALELGLVDELGGMSKAIEVAKTEAGIPSDENVRLVYLPEKRSFWQNLLWPEEDATARTGLPPEVVGVVRDLARAAIMAREGVWLVADTPGPAQ